MLSLCFPVILLSGVSGRAYAADSTEIQEWLQAHNRYRSLHAAPGVTWSAALAQSARDWAGTCPSGHSATPYGENIAYASRNKSAADVVALWYGEKAGYDFAKPGQQPGTGHFTQVVWKKTARIGCAHSAGCAGAWSDIWVCQYSPPGNIAGKYAANVFRPGSPVALPAE
jgi:uncharacterized protein YkwD